MVRTELHPDRPPRGPDVVPQRPLPDAVRAFRKFPNIEDWRPGDLLLTRQLHPNIVARHIHRLQERLHHRPFDARWTHVAIYVGDGMICEALPGRGIVVNPIENRMLGRIMLVRRPVGLGPVDGYRIVIACLTALRTHYGLLTAAGAAWAALRSRGHLGTAFIVRSSHICSTLYNDAYTQVTETILCPAAHGRLPLPADLSFTDKLMDIETMWRPLPE